MYLVHVVVFVDGNGMTMVQLLRIDDLVNQFYSVSSFSAKTTVNGLCQG